MTYQRRKDCRYCTFYKRTEKFSFLEQFAMILSSDLTTIRFVTILIYALTSIGFFVTRNDVDAREMIWMSRIVSDIGWSVIFGVLALSRYVFVFTNIYNIKYAIYLRFFFSFIGLGVWSVLLTSVFVEDLETLSMLCFVPCFLEVWLLGRTLDDINKGASNE